MKPIPIFNPDHYRRFSRYWWHNWAKYLTTGWLRDIRRFIHRGRYGWASVDAWNLDTYLAFVLAGALDHFARNKIGSPAGYPDLNGEGPTDHDQWRDDLYRWAAAFRAYTTKHSVDTIEREEEVTVAAQNALRQMTPWFPDLWD